METHKFKMILRESMITVFCPLLLLHSGNIECYGKAQFQNKMMAKPEERERVQKRKCISYL